MKNEKNIYTKQIPYRYFYLIFLFFCFCSPITFASIITVTNANNSGAGSLRAAIDQANSNSGSDVIQFDIQGIVPPIVISVSSVLPSLTDAGTTIDGSTQPANGFSGVSPKIIIDGAALGNSGNGLNIIGNNIEIYGIYLTRFPYDGLSISGDSFILGGVGKGNVINGNEYDQVEINNVSGGIIKSNKIGTDTTGTQPGAADNIGYDGISIENSQLITIGGSLAGEGNLISGNNYGGIDIRCSSDNEIKGNLIGTDITGTYAVPNQYSGIDISGEVYGTVCSAQNNQIGGDDEDDGNLISGNGYQGIDIACGSDNIIRNNKIGTDINGENAISNEYDGIKISGGYSQCLAQNNLIGGTDKQENIIGYNEYYGVRISGTGSTGNLISANSIFCNDYGGINLSLYYGPGNNNYPPPIITSVGNATIFGTANPNDIIEVFSDDNCPDCQGKSYLGTAIADSTGNWLYSGGIGTLTATATDANNNTSPFSACVLFTDVTNPLSNSEVLIYPNPTIGEFGIHLKNYETISNTAWTFTLYDVTGRNMLEIKDIQSSSIQVDKPQLPSGVYFFRLSAEHVIFKTGKIVMK